MIPFGFILTAIIAGVHSDPTLMNRVDLTDTDKQAVCNDNSSGVYYWKESPN